MKMVTKSKQVKLNEYYTNMEMEKLEEAVAEGLGTFRMNIGNTSKDIKEGFYGFTELDGEIEMGVVCINKANINSVTYYKDNKVDGKFNYEAYIAKLKELGLYK